MPASVQEGSLSSTTSPPFIVCRLFDKGHSYRCELMCDCSFDFHFCKISWFWNPFKKKTKNGMSKTELPSLAFWQSALFWILFQDICWGQVSFPCIPAGLVKRKCSCERKEREVAQSCPTLCNPVDCSLPGFSVHGILQARILEWAAISFFRGSSRRRDRIRVSHNGGRSFKPLSPQGIGA